MSAEDFDDETRRERHEEEREARTLDQEIADLASDLADLDAIVQSQAAELVLLRAEHRAGRIMRAVPDIHSTEFIDAYRPWADAHDRTELAT